MDHVERPRTFEINIIRRLEAVEADSRRREEVQQKRHEENTQHLYRIEKETSERFSVIEKIITETAVYLKVGHWTMNVLAAIFGGMVVALMTRWIGAKL